MEMPMTSSLFRAAFGAAIAAGLCCAAHGEFTVAAGGVPQADIVVPGKANAIERYAADELRYHLAKMVGSDFAVISETELGASKMRHHFFLGATKAAKAEGLLDTPLVLEEHRVKTVGGNLFLFGRDVVRGDVADLWAKCRRGTMYAVYDFLAKSCGVRWLWPGEKGEYVPRRREDQHHAPRMAAPAEESEGHALRAQACRKPRALLRKRHAIRRGRDILWKCL